MFEYYIYDKFTGEDDIIFGRSYKDAIHRAGLEKKDTDGYIILKTYAYAD